MSGFLLQLFWFLVAIMLLVTLHEYGHFQVARALGIRVLRFSFGWGAPLWSRRGKDGVEYALAPFPIGGYVMFDERGTEPAPTEDGRIAFHHAPVWKRALVLLAGPVANLLFAVFACWAILVMGVPEVRPVIGQVVAGSPAAAAGLQRDDEIVAVRGAATGTWGDASLGLLGAVLAGEDSTPVTVRAADGAEHHTVLALADSHGLTEPGALLTRLGLKPLSDATLEPVIGKVVPGGPAEHAGLKAGDRITAIDGQPVAEFGDVRRLVQPAGGKTLAVAVLRDGSSITARVEVKTVEFRGRSYGQLQVEPRGGAELRARILFERRYGALEAVPTAFRQTVDLGTLTVKMVWKMLTGGASLSNISGPLSIAQGAGDAATLGFGTFLWFLAIISLSLGVLNLLPVPILDGGQLVFLAVEAASGRPVPARVELVGQQVGILLLIGMMGLAFYNDIARLLG